MQNPMKPELDDKDKIIKDKRERKWNEIPGPRVGDFIQRKDGKLARFSHEWQDGLQSSVGGSFFIGESGISFSGSLDDNIPFENIQPTDETRNGTFWFFHHNQWQAHNGVHFEMPCRVFKEKQ